MAVGKTRSNYNDTAEGQAIRLKLHQMVSDTLYSTDASYSSNSMLYPDNEIPFVDKHMDYLVKHPALDASKYLANLRLMTKIR